jgi:phospholipid/cholesterol/gamma-HCH transport system ATP-binding protein
VSRDGEGGDDRRTGLDRRETTVPGAPESEAPSATDQEDQKHSKRVRAAIRDELAGDIRPDEHARFAPGAPQPPRRRVEEPKPAVIALDHVSLSFDQPILEDISIAAYEGETICIVGESGTGKSTALKLILRLLQPDKGQVCIDGDDIAPLSFDEALEVRKKMGMVFQGAALFDSMTVYENVAYPLREHFHLAEEEIERRVREKLEFVDLEPDRVLEQLPSELSGGMRKRVGIARAMSGNPEIMLYDEPTSGLDPLTTGTITRLIMKLQRELNVTSVVVSHDVRSVFKMATKVALLSERRIKFFGTPEEMMGSEDRYIQDFLGGT